MIDFDTQDKYPLPSVRAWIRAKFAGWGWHEWFAVLWCAGMVAVMGLATAIHSGCVSGYAEQKKNQAKQAIGVGVEKVSNMTFGVTAPTDGNSLGLIYWASWLLIAASVVSLILSFVPIVRLFFEARKAAITTGVLGIAGLLIYDFLVEWRWVIYVIAIVGACFALYSYLPAIKSPKKFLASCWELVTRNDDNKDGHIGPWGGRK